MMWYDKYIEEGAIVTADPRKQYVYWINKYDYHRTDGPAVIYQPNDSYNGKNEFWFIHDRDITDEVEKWITEHDYPNYKEWDDAVKTHFKLTFL